MGNTHDTQIARIEADFIEPRWKTSNDYRWGYSRDRGPDTWWVHHPTASGGSQSPVDIHIEDVTTLQKLTSHPLQINYTSSSSSALLPGKNIASSSTQQKSGGKCLTSMSCQGLTTPSNFEETKIFANNGNTSVIHVLDSKSYISGGPLKESCYVLERVELHWGENDNNGSEHLLNSRPFAAEVHLVHWNEDLYDSYDEAKKKEDGLAVLAVWAKLSDSNPNKVLKLWSNQLEDIQYRGQSVKASDEISIADLLPNDTSKYWTYKGSSTYPPCHENITWIVFSPTISVTSQVLGLFRGLRSYSDNETRPNDEFQGTIRANCRPIQPLGTRKILAPEMEVARRRRPKTYEGLLQEQTAVRVSIFPELFDPNRREELFQWLQ